MDKKEPILQIEKNTIHQDSFRIICIKNGETYCHDYDVKDFRLLIDASDDISSDNIFQIVNAGIKRPFTINENSNEEKIQISFKDPLSLFSLELLVYTPSEEEVKKEKEKKMEFRKSTIEWKGKKYPIEQVFDGGEIIYRYKGNNYQYQVKVDENNINNSNKYESFTNIDDIYYKLNKSIINRNVSFEEKPGEKVTLTFNFKIYSFSLRKEMTPSPPAPPIEDNKDQNIPIVKGEDQQQEKNEENKKKNEEINEDIKFVKNPINDFIKKKEEIDLSESFNSLKALFGKEKKNKTKDESNKTKNISIKSIEDSLLLGDDYREINKIMIEDYSNGIRQLAYENDNVDKKIDRCKELLKEIGVPQNRGPAIKDKAVNMKTRIILKEKEFKLIDNRLKKNGAKKVEYDLLYRASKDRDRAKIFKEKCKDIKGTLIIVHTKNNKKFGGYTEQTWNGEDELKKDKNAFCFSIDNDKIYEIKNEDTVAIHCSGEEEKFGPRFYYMFTLDDKFFLRGGWLDSKGPSSFTGQESDYELNNGESNFEVYEVEAFQVKLTK